jgi:hypothetical protein
MGDVECSGKVSRSIFVAFNSARTGFVWVEGEWFPLTLFFGGIYFMCGPAVECGVLYFICEE